MPPTNITAATAIEITSLPASIVLDVTELTDILDVWYKYTAPVNMPVIGVFAWANPALTAYRPSVSAWVGIPPTLTSYLFADSNTKPVTPKVIPLTEATVYYFRIKNMGVGIPTAAILNLSVLPSPNEDVVAGALFVNDDADGYPAAILDPVDGHVRRYITPFPYGEMGDILPNGKLLYKANDRTKLGLYDTDLTLLASPSPFPAHVEEGDTYIDGTNPWYPQIRSNNLDTFFVANLNAYDNSCVLKTVSDAGVIGATSWTLPNVPNGIGVSPNGTILYYGYGTGIYRYDLVNSTALAPLRAHGIDTGFWFAAQKDLIVQADGTLLVTYEIGTPTYGGEIRHYAANGTLLNTYDMSGGGTGYVWVLNRLARAVEDNAFWVWRFGMLNTGFHSGQSRYTKIQVSDGTILADFTVDEINEGWGQESSANSNPTRFGPSNSCPLVVLRRAVARNEQGGGSGGGEEGGSGGQNGTGSGEPDSTPPQIGGIYFINPVKYSKNDSYYQNLDKKIPDPIVRLPFIGE
jgi:hypothetical protein